MDSKRLQYLPLRSSVILMTAIISINAQASDTVENDIITVTATRTERSSAEVPESISIIDQERLEQEKMFNIGDALKGTPGVLIQSTSGGSSSRLIVRGAGLKARYGIREIMVLRDGVPITDPDSFTRMDFVDTQDIEQIEVSKGPANIYATGSTGGAIHIISKSVFDNRRDQLRLGLGEQGTENLHLRKSWMTESGDALAVTLSHRAQDNDWRRNNEYQSDQISLKSGILISETTELEMELSATKSELNLPGTMDEDQFNSYLRTGKQTDTESAFKHNARNSDIIFFNSRLTMDLGDLTFRPRFYYNHWSHFHPVTGVINDTPGVDIIGTDLELDYSHKLFGNDNLVAGVTLRQDRNENSRKYAYADTTTSGMRIISTLSDRKGDLLEIQDEVNTVYGFFMQENLRPAENWLIDAGFRYDQISIEQDTWNSDTAYNYGVGGYLTIPNSGGNSSLNRTFELFSPRIGSSYKLNDTFTLYGNISRGEQVPFASELESNNDLKSPTNTSFEIGIKGRAADWQLDLNTYTSTVDDEIIQVRTDGETLYQNAGQTEKKGVELSGTLEILKQRVPGSLQLGLNYAYSDYRYKEFSEVVYVMGTPTNFERTGNQLPFIPQHYYSINLDYKHPSGFKARVQADSWGEYYLDNANSETYGGYDFVTTLNLGYETGPHNVSLNVQNLFDKRYAVEVTKDTGGDKSYSPGAPRSMMLSYTYSF